MEYEVDGDTNRHWNTWNDAQGIGKGNGRLENKRTREDYSDNSIIMISQNTGVLETRGDLLSFQLPWKTTS